MFVPFTSLTFLLNEAIIPKIVTPINNAGTKTSNILPSFEPCTIQIIKPTKALIIAIPKASKNNHNKDLLVLKSFTLNSSVFSISDFSLRYTTFSCFFNIVFTTGLAKVNKKT